MFARTVRDVCRFLDKILPKDRICVETGCMYVTSENNLVHTTTNNIAEYVCSTDGLFFSIDIDKEHLRIAKEFLEETSLTDSGNVFLLGGDSLDVLHYVKIFTAADGMGTIDLLWLDSKEFDPDHAVKEFKIIEPILSEQHVVCVDDIHNPGSVKWEKIVPLLKEKGYNYIEIDTPTGLFVASKGYDLEELKNGPRFPDTL